MMASQTKTSTVVLVAVILAFVAIVGFFLWTGAQEGSSIGGTQEVTSTGTAIAVPITEDPNY
jgi:hypothetical protein